MTSWVVVRFLEENNVEVVPTNWLSTDDKFCYWPPEDYENINKAIKQCTPVEQTWSKFAIKTLSTKSYANFGLASSKASKACVTSDLSENEVLPTKRPIRRVIFTDSDESSEEVDNLPLPKPPHPPRIQRCSTMDTTGRSRPNYRTTEKQDLINLESSKSLQASQSTQGRKGLLGVTSESFDKFKEEVLRQIITIRTMLKDQQDYLEENRKLLNYVIEKVDNIERKDGKREEEVDITNGIMDMFPLKEENQLEQINDLLEDQPTMKSVVKNLSRLGGSNFKDAVRRILTKTFSDEFAQQFSYRGHKGKKDFSKLKIAEVVLQAVQVADRNNTSTIKDVEGAIAIWLSKAFERVKRREIKT